MTVNEEPLENLNFENKSKETKQDIKATKENKPEADLSDKAVEVTIASPSFDKELRTFIAHIGSLSATLELTMNTVNDAFIKID